MCQRCVYMEDRENLVDNVTNTFDEDVTGTEHLVVEVLLINIETNEVSYIARDYENSPEVHEALSGANVPYFKYTVPIICHDKVSPLAIKEAMERGSELPDSVKTMKDLDEYVQDVGNNEHIITIQFTNSPEEAEIAEFMDMIRSLQTATDDEH